MRTQTLALAAVLAAAALSANAETRMEPVNSPFTYEALGATPTLTLGRARTTAPKAVEATKPAAPAHTGTAQRAPAAAVTPFTYDALGATPHVGTKKPATTEALAPSSAR